MNVGVIGGADGPTAVFVTSSVDWAFLAGVAFVMAASVIAFCLWRKK